MSEKNTILQRNDELVVHIEQAAFEGKTIARVQNFVIFVENAVPGDVATIRIRTVKKNYAEATVLNIITPSPRRVTPRCRYVGVCGGCKWQHVAYETQLRFKEQHVADAFERIGGFSHLPLRTIIGADSLYFYRNKMEYSFAVEQWKWEGMGENDAPPYLGLHVPQRYDKVLDITECFLQSQQSNEILNFTRSFVRERKLTVYDSHTEKGLLRFLVLREGKRTGQTLVNLVTSDTAHDILKEYTTQLLASFPFVTTVVNTINRTKAQVATGSEERIYYGTGTIEEQLGSYRFLISAGSFFQTNSVQAEKLYEVTKSLGDFSKEDVLYDLYCGTGTIAIFLSDVVKQAIGIETVASAVRDAERNAALNSVSNCNFLLGDLRDLLTKETDWQRAVPPPTALVIDPPRSGMHPKVVEKILQLAPRRIVYVSCNPTTQARDIKMLCETAYTLAALQPVDMFPHTYHIENVALLVK